MFNPFVFFLSETPSTGSIATIITAITQLVNGAITWITSYVSVITDTPLILVFVIVAFVGLGIGLIRRSIRL